MVINGCCGSRNHAHSHERKKRKGHCLLAACRKKVEPLPEGLQKTSSHASSGGTGPGLFVSPSLSGDGQGRKGESQHASHGDSQHLSRQAAHLHRGGDFAWETSPSPGPRLSSLADINGLSCTRDTTCRKIRFCYQGVRSVLV